MNRFIKLSIITFVFFSIIENVKAQTTFDPDTENVFIRFDKVKPLLKKWNEAISTHQVDELNKIYADTLDYYVTRKSKQECMDGKSKWLLEHTGYKQKMGYLQLYYMDEDENASTIIAEFAKISYEKGDSSKVTAFLHFKKVKGEWKLYKESDEGSEISKARKNPVVTLQKGKYEFYHGYTVDYRSNLDVVDYSLANYHFSLSLEISDKITGEYNSYSGGLRENINYLIPGGKMKEGILELIFIWNGDYSYSMEDYYKGEIPENRKEIRQFKIISEKEIVCLGKDGYVNGKSLKSVK